MGALTDQMMMGRFFWKLVDFGLSERGWWPIFRVYEG